MPIKDRSGGPIADDVTYGVGVLNPSAPVPGLRPPGDPGYRQPADADSIFSRSRWRDWTAYVVSSALVNLPNEQTTFFPIYSLTVDNQTSQWFKFKGSHSRFIPPWMYGVVLRTGGEQKFELQLEAPPGVTQAAVSGHYITVSATEEKMPPSPGIPLMT